MVRMSSKEEKKMIHLQNGILTSTAWVFAKHFSKDAGKYPVVFWEYPKYHYDEREYVNSIVDYVSRCDVDAKHVFVGVSMGVRPLRLVVDQLVEQGFDASKLELIAIQPTDDYRMSNINLMRKGHILARVLLVIVRSLCYPICWTRFVSAMVSYRCSLGRLIMAKIRMKGRFAHSTPVFLSLGVMLDLAIAVSFGLNLKHANEVRTTAILSDPTLDRNVYYPEAERVYQERADGKCRIIRGIKARHGALRRYHEDFRELFLQLDLISGAKK